MTTGEQLPVHILVKDVADGRSRRGERLDHMNAGRSACWREAQNADQQGVGYDPEGHAERAVDQLRGKTDADKGDQCLQMLQGKFWQ